MVQHRHPKILLECGVGYFRKHTPGQWWEEFVKAYHAKVLDPGTTDAGDQLILERILDAAVTAPQ